MLREQNHTHFNLELLQLPRVANIKEKNFIKT
jgi:hypothetical protein